MAHRPHRNDCRVDSTAGRFDVSAPASKRGPAKGLMSTLILRKACLAIRAPIGADRGSCSLPIFPLSSMPGRGMGGSIFDTDAQPGARRPPNCRAFLELCGPVARYSDTAMCNTPEHAVSSDNVHYERNICSRANSILKCDL